MVLAKILGIFFIVFGMSYLFNRKSHRKVLDKLAKSEEGFFILGIITLLMGLVIVVLHSYWNTTAEILISIIGWGAVLKGILIIFDPIVMMKFSKKFMKGEGWIHLGGIVSLVFGVYLYWATIMG